MSSVTVTYRRNMRGQVTAVGTAEAPERFATYSFEADGSIATETLGGGQLARSCRYDGLQRLVGLPPLVVGTGEG